MPGARRRGAKPDAASAYQRPVAAGADADPAVRERRPYRTAPAAGPTAALRVPPGVKQAPGGPRFAKPLRMPVETFAASYRQRDEQWT
jgi:hypothetical protein